MREYFNFSYQREQTSVNLSQRTFCGIIISADVINVAQNTKFHVIEPDSNSHY